MAMEKDCKICEKFQKHHYWSHSDCYNIHFCKKMEGLYMQSMTLPSEFSKNFKGIIGETVHLKPQTGTETWYHVRAKRSDEKLVFKSGWKDFITSNKIQQNDLLLFRYCAVSSFEVTVFNASHCNWSSPVLGRNGEEMSDDESVKIVEPPAKQKDETICISSDKESSFKGLRRVLEEETFESKKVGVKRGRGRPRKMKETGTSSRASIHVQKEIVKETGMSSRAAIHVKKEKGTKTESDTECQLSFLVPKNVTLSKRQERIANEMSRAAQIGNPMFVHVMCESKFYPSSYLEIPDNFAPQILKKTDRTIVLQSPDMKKKWKCWYYYFSMHDMRAIEGVDWKKFVFENGFKKGDLCLFELMKNERETLTMTVHVHVHDR